MKLPHRNGPEFAMVWFAMTACAAHAAPTTPKVGAAGDAPEAEATSAASASTTGAGPRPGREGSGAADTSAEPVALDRLPLGEFSPGPYESLKPRPRLGALPRHLQAVFQDGSLNIRDRATPQSVQAQPLYSCVQADASHGSHLYANYSVYPGSETQSVRALRLNTDGEREVLESNSLAIQGTSALAYGHAVMPLLRLTRLAGGHDLFAGREQRDGKTVVHLVLKSPRSLNVFGIPQVVEERRVSAVIGHCAFLYAAVTLGNESATAMFRATAQIREIRSEDVAGPVTAVVRPLTLAVSVAPIPDMTRARLTIAASWAGEERELNRPSMRFSEGSLR
jgi:hypothetical protein